MEIMNQIMKNGPALLIVVGSVLAIWGSYVSSNRNDRQQELIQKTGEANSALGENNNQLATQIQQLQRLNNVVSNSTKDLVEENKKVTTDNLALTEQSKALIENVAVLTKKVNELLVNVHKELTGANSIPVIHAELRFNPTDHFGRGINLPRPELENKWIIEYKIQNDGSFPVRNVRIFRKHTRPFAAVIEDGEISGIENLNPNETKRVEPTFIISNHTEYFTFKIQFKVEYSYNVTVEYGEIPQTNGEVPKENFTMKEYYLYKDIKYETITELKTAIQKDIQE